MWIPLCILHIFKNSHDSIEINSDIELAYSSQLQREILNEFNTILEEFLDAGFKTYAEIRSYLILFFHQCHFLLKLNMIHHPFPM